MSFRDHLRCDGVFTSNYIGSPVMSSSISRLCFTFLTLLLTPEGFINLNVSKC